MKTSRHIVSRRNISWKIPAGLLALALLAAWAAPAQAAGCACSTKNAKSEASGAASCCGGTSGPDAGGATCSCGGSQGKAKAGHGHSMTKSPAGKSAGGAKNTQGSPRKEMPDYAKRALAALQGGDMAAAEAILQAQYMRKSTADGRQAGLAVAAGLARLAAGMHGKGQQAARKGAMDRALALADETIGGATGGVKARALMVKAQILKQDKGDEADIQGLVDAARELDPGNRDVLRFSRQNSRPARP
jgi:hypothetical protein